MPTRRLMVRRSRRVSSAVKRFNRAIDWAEDQQLIAVVEIDGTTYLRLSRPEPGSHEQV